MLSDAVSERVQVLYVSTDGCDEWSGRLAQPDQSGTDGPFATIKAAQQAVRRMRGRRKQLLQSIRVVLRGGTYFLERELTFTPRDGGWFYPDKTLWPPSTKPGCSVTYTAYEDEHPVISGGRRINNFKSEKLNGRTVWVADLPAVKRGTWTFTQLWVNGRRAKRPRLPKNGFYRIEKLVNADLKGDYAQGQDRFVFRKKDIHRWRNINDVQFVALHFWIETRRRFKHIDYDNQIAQLDYPSCMKLTDDYTGQGAIYYVDNVFEALTEPGEWYLDRPTGKLYYLPRKGEQLEKAEVIAPVLEQLVRIEGDKEKNEPVACLHFESIAFSHNEEKPATITKRLAAGDSIQSACMVPGAIGLSYAEKCTFTHCRMAHVGTYGVDIRDGSLDIGLHGCMLEDLGAGGVKIWHGCNRNAVSDCTIRDAGHLNRSGVGVLIGKSSGNKVTHCHIHDLDYSGISIGWTWGYADGHAYGNIIEYNHVHDIGRGMLSDMGAIYTLGDSQGTRIRYNIVHDVSARTYSSQGIHADEGSSNILIESNLVYHIQGTGLGHHYGQDSLYRNNIFALNTQGQITRTQPEVALGNSFYFENNIVYFSQGSALGGNWKPINATFRRNLYFDTRDPQVKFADMSFTEWKKLGQDQGGRVADPMFINPEKGDFRLHKNSPALAMGFQPWDFSLVGPRKTFRASEQ